LGLTLVTHASPANTMTARASPTLRTRQNVTSQFAPEQKLKQGLLRKRLRPFLQTVLRAFAPGNESVCTLMLEGVVSQLQDSDLIIQTHRQILSAN
jgi:hypothetical protein